MSLFHDRKTRYALILAACVVAYAGLYCLTLVIFHLDNLVYEPTDSVSPTFARNAKWIASFIAIPFFAISLAGVVAGPLCLLLALGYRKKLYLSTGALVIGIILIECSVHMWQFIGWYNTPQYRETFRKAFVGVTIRAEPLVDALQKYREDKGMYPAVLELLVPNYIPDIPNTGLAGYHEFRYYRHGTDEFKLCVKTSRNPLNFDEFVFLSDHKYPNTPEYEAVDDWVYFHE